MSDTDDVDTVFEGIDIEGQNQKIQEYEGESIDTMSEESSNSQDEVEDTSVDTDFSNVEIEGSTESSTIDTPDISTDSFGLGNDASETWGENKEEIRIDSDKLTETTKTTNSHDESRTENTQVNTDSDSDSQSSPEDNTMNTSEDSNTDIDTDFSGVDIEGAVDGTEHETSSTNHVNSDVNENNDTDHITEPTQSSTQSEQDSNIANKNTITENVSTKELDEISKKRVRSPIEILTAPFRGLIDSSKFIASACFDFFILSLMVSGLAAKAGFVMGLFTYAALTVFIIVLPPLVGMHLVANGVVDPNPTRIELFTMISIFYIPVLVFLWGVDALGKYLHGDADETSSEEKHGFSRW